MLNCPLMYFERSAFLSFRIIEDEIKKNKHDLDLTKKLVLIMISLINQDFENFILIIPSPTKLRRDIVMLPSVRPSVTSL